MEFFIDKNGLYKLKFGQSYFKKGNIQEIMIKIYLISKF